MDRIDDQSGTWSRRPSSNYPVSQKPEWHFAADNFSLWFVVVALLSLISIWLWFPLSFIFLAYIAAFNLKLLPSPNFFDYITDGFLFLLSMGVLVFLGRQGVSGLEENQVEAEGPGSPASMSE